MLLLDNCQYMKISYLKPAETRRLITEPSRGCLKFAEGVIDVIQELVGGHPFYTQLLCRDLFDLLQGKGIVTGRHVNQAVKHFLDNPSPHLILGWNALDLQEKVVASTVAELQATPEQWVAPAEVSAQLAKVRYPIRVGLGEIQQSLANLRERDWIDKKEGDRVFRFALGLVRCWLAEDRSIWEVLEEYQKGLTDRISPLRPRTFAAALDAAFLLCMLLALNAYDLLPSWAPPLIVLGYFCLLLPPLGSTPGMAAARIRVLSETGARLPYLRALSFTLLLSAPFALLALIVPVIAKGAPAALGWVLFWTAVALLGIHAARIHLSKSRRGLYDHIVRAVVVRR